MTPCIPYSASRVYLSGPMTGYAQDNRPAFRTNTKLLRSMGLEVISPDELDEVSPPAGATWADYLARDLPYVLSCGQAVVMEGWTKSNGAKLEIAIMAALGRPVFSIGTVEGPYGPMSDLVPVPRSALPIISFPS